LNLKFKLLPALTLPARRPGDNAPPGVSHRNRAGAQHPLLGETRSQLRVPRPIRSIIHLTPATILNDEQQKILNYVQQKILNDERRRTAGGRRDTAATGGRAPSG